MKETIAAAVKGVEKVVRETGAETVERKTVLVTGKRGVEIEVTVLTKKMRRKEWTVVKAIEKEAEVKSGSEAKAKKGVAVLAKTGMIVKMKRKLLRAMEE